MRAESSPIVRLSTRDIAPADRLNYANWILSVADEHGRAQLTLDDAYHGIDIVRECAQRILHRDDG